MGNDVAAALREGYQHIVAVEIDPVIISLGKRLHPERPYEDPRVSTVTDDARAYFIRYPDERFDVVCYGLLDSHSMFSAMSSLRLDNYVYTLEGIRQGWAHVRPGGLLSVSFASNAGPWMIKRLALLIREGTGKDPILIPHGVGAGITYIAGAVDRETVPARSVPRPVRYAGSAAAVRLPTDDWPFLYLRPNSFPLAYVVVLGLIVLSAATVVSRLVGFRSALREAIDWPLFFLGAAFMLLETRMVTEMSLLFGSTWIVNASVFFAILVMVLAATLATMRGGRMPLEFWFVPLLLSLLLLWGIRTESLCALPIAARLLAGGLILAAPVGFAAVIFAILFEKAKNPAMSFGANLLGAVLGGALEYLSMMMGLRTLIVLVAVLYGVAFLAIRARAANASVGALPTV